MTEEYSPMLPSDSGGMMQRSAAVLQERKQELKKCTCPSRQIAYNIYMCNLTAMDFNAANSTLDKTLHFRERAQVDYPK
jgi:hypothetical protein